MQTVEIIPTNCVPALVDAAAVEAFAAAADRNPVLVLLGRLGAGSRRATAQRLGRAAAILSGGEIDPIAFSWASLRYEHVARLVALLVEAGSAPATCNAVLAAVKGVLREAWRLGQIGVEDFHRAVDVKPAKGSRLPAGRSVSPAEVRALVAACEADASPAGARDAAMLALLATGLRRAEIVARDLADLDQESGALRITASKGQKDRIVYLKGATLAAVRDWVAMRGSEPGPLLLAVNKAGRLGDRRLTTQAIYTALHARQEEAGIATMSPHDFRRTVAGELLDAGTDIVTVAAFLGHANVATTARYDRRGERAKEAAAGNLLFPYMGRRA